MLDDDEFNDSVGTLFVTEASPEIVGDEVAEDDDNDETVEVLDSESAKPDDVTERE